MKGYIYKITSPSGKIYIGQTNDIEKRKINYEKLLCKAQRLLYSSIKKYGWDNHKLEVLLEVNDVSELLQLEIETIFKHKYYNLLKNLIFNNNLRNVCFKKFLK